MTQANTGMTPEQFTAQATLEALCAQRNEALDRSAQALAAMRLSDATMNAFKKGGEALLKYIDGDEVVDVEAIRKLFALQD